MRIVENTPDRLHVVSGSAYDLVGALVAAVFHGVWCAVVAVFLFALPANYLAPGWAEENNFYMGLDGQWEVVAAWFTWIILAAVAVFCVGELLPLLRYLAVGVRRHLVIDRRTGLTTLSQRGLFRVPNCAIPLGKMQLFLVPNEDEGASHTLTVTFPGLTPKLRRGMFWYAGDTSHDVKSEQVDALRPWAGLYPPLLSAVAQPA